MNRKSKLMISYCHANEAEAQKIADMLKGSFEILIDENYFRLSRSTQPEMKRMVGDADVVLVLLSPASVASNPVRYEVKCALARELDEQRKIVFAAMIEHCAPMPEWDSTRLYARLHSDFQREFARLKRSLLAAAAKALPRATTIPDSDTLIQLAKESITASRFNIIGDVDIRPYDADRSDDFFSLNLLNIDRISYFSAFIATCGTWTCFFFYIPRVAILGKMKERLGSISSPCGRLWGRDSQHTSIMAINGMRMLHS